MGLFHCTVPARLHLVKFFHAANKLLFNVGADVTALAAQNHKHINNAECGGEGEAEAVCGFL